MKVLIGCKRLLFFVWEMLIEANNPFKENFDGKRKKKKWKSEIVKKSEKRWEQNEVIRSCTEKLKTKAKVKHTLEFVNLAKSLKRMKVLWHLIGCERLLFFVWEMLTEANNPFKESFYGKRKKKGN